MVYVIFEFCVRSNSGRGLGGQTDSCFVIHLSAQLSVFGKRALNEWALRSRAPDILKRYLSQAENEHSRPT